MAQNLKKLFTFSSQKNRVVIESMIKDQASVESRTESALIERMLLGGLLPKNGAAAYWVINLYDQGGEGALGRALYSVFAYLAAGVDWKASEKNGKPIVEFFRQLLFMHNPILSGDERELYHLKEQLDSINDMISKMDDGEGARDAKLGRELLKVLEEEPKSAILSDHVTFILENWNTLSDFTRTYRALCDIATIAGKGLPDTPETRYKFWNLLRTISEEWKS